MKQKIAIILILAGGFLLRAYNINSPSIGYHSMQENEYLSVAQEMMRTGDFLNKRVYFYNAFEENPVLKKYNQPPLVPYQIILSWNMLGENLWSARLFNILFGVLSIITIYFIAGLFFDGIYLPLYTALLLAILPLAVFFSRNLQPESPAFFFMLLGQFFYLRYSFSTREYNLLLGGAAFSLAWVYRFNFIMGTLPLLFCFPWRAVCKDRDKLINFIFALAIPYFIIPYAVGRLMHLGQWQFGSIDWSFLEIFSAAYWKNFGKPIWLYVTQENFTPIFFVLGAFGILTAFLRRKDLLSRYIIGWSSTAVLYMVIYSGNLYQNNYFQMPFLALACISSAYALRSVSAIAKKVIKKDLLLLFIILSVAMSAPFVYGSLVRFHRTVFLGMDVAGESLREWTSDNERVFLYTHFQGNGIARYARRYAGWQDKLDDFKRAEQKFNIRYICFYPAEFAHALKANNPALFKYIQENYHYKEAGIVEEPRQIVYIILEKGEGSKPQTFLQEFAGSMQLRNIYRLLGKYVFFYAIRPTEK